MSGIVASVCCIGPLVFSMLGLSGAAMAHRFAPLRPYFLVLTYAVLGAAFFWTYRPQAQVCQPGESCEMPRSNRPGKLMLWGALIVVLLTTAFTWYAQYLF